MSRSSQSGNVFFLILAAVAMFAALAWAFTQGSRQSASGLTSEQNRLAAQEIIDFGNQLTDTIQKLKLRGCQDTQFDFSNPSWTLHSGIILYPDSINNPNAPVSGCDIFSPADGKLNAIIFPKSYMYDWTSIGAGNTAIGHSRIYKSTVPGIGDPASEELIYNLPTVKTGVCQEINNILGVTNPGGDVPSVVQVGSEYTGVFNGTGSITNAGGEITGKTAFCVKSSAAPQDYRFIQVLIAR